MFHGEHIRFLMYRKTIQRGHYRNMFFSVLPIGVYGRLFSWV